MWTGDLDNIEQVALYMNAELQKGRSQKEIEINDFGVNEKVIKNRLNRKGYKKNIDINQWVLVNIEYDMSNTKVIKTQQPNKNEYDISHTQVITDKNIKNNLINLAKNYDKIMSIVQGYDKKYDGLTIELPVETIKDFRTSIRVNNVIWEQFNQFTNANKEFTKRDLISMALKEFIDKYNK